MKRRELMVGAGTAAMGLALSRLPVRGAEETKASKRRLLFFTKSSGFEHSVVKRQGDRLSYAEQILTDLGAQHGFEVTCTKDGSVFTPENLARYDAFCFYTTGDLTQTGTDKNPPMSAAGKSALLEAIRSGKGFIGSHAATDTFHTRAAPGGPPDRSAAQGANADPYIAMIGAEFIRHGAQQVATMRVVDHHFPGFGSLPDHFDLMEEWYSLKEFAPNLHVLLVQETGSMKGNEYRRAPYPATWARMHGKGRVFYTSMGHREDVWTNPLFQGILLGGISWAAGSVDADVTPNLEAVAPGYRELPTLS